MFSVLIGGLSALIGAFGGLNQTIVRGLMAFSSITHIGWIISLSFVGRFYSLLYFAVYSILTTFVFILIGYRCLKISYNYDLGFNKFKVGQFLVILSLAGLPPFVGFFIKLIGVVVLSEFLLLIFILLFSSFLSLYYYIILSFTVCSNRCTK